MSATPGWILGALRRAESLALDNAADRQLLTELLIEHLPKEEILLAIESSCSTEFRVRGIRDDGAEMAQKISRGAAQALWLTLERQ